MKVQLEQKTESCAQKLLCTVCGQIFKAGSMRTLLYNRHNLLQGDVCSDCMQLKQNQFRQKLRDRANLLLKLSDLDPQTRTARRIRALELLEAAAEPVYFPAPYQWWWKRLEVLSDETILLEQARISRGPRSGHPTNETRSRLERLLAQQLDSHANE
jgi:hypothetical protein